VAANLNHPSDQVHVSPFQPQELSNPKAGEDGRLDYGAILGWRLLDQSADLPLFENPFLPRRNVPLLREMRGFVDYYWVDAGGGVMLSTSIFEDQDCAKESTAKAADFVHENLEPLLPNPPQVTAGEVVARGT
jgi:hypothetical protein